MGASVRLRELGSTYGGLTGKTKADFGHGGTAPFVTFLEVINSTRLQGRPLERVQVRKGETQNRVLRGDLLFNGSSETPDEVALSTVVDFEPDAGTYLNSFCFGYRLRPGVGVDATFLAYFFRSPVGRALVSSLAQGATRYNIAKTKFLDLELDLPPADQQRTTVEALIDADELVATLERLIAKKQAIKQGMMQQLLTGKSRLPGFAEPWADVRLDELAKFGKGMGLPKSAVIPSGQFPCIHYGELFTQYGAEIHSIQSRTNDVCLRVRSSAHDVLMPTSDVTPRGLAKASSVHTDGVILGGDILVIRADASRLFGPFLANAIRQNADQVLQLVRGSTVFHLYASDMKTFEVELPSIDEQRTICVALRDAESEIAALRARLVKAKAVKHGMIQELLTGRTRLPVDDGAA